MNSNVGNHFIWRRTSRTASRRSRIQWFSIPSVRPATIISPRISRPQASPRVEKVKRLRQFHRNGTVEIHPARNVWHLILGGCYYGLRLKTFTEIITYDAHYLVDC